MSTNHRDNPRPRDRQSDPDSFIARRFQAFADRSRDPGDAVTWTVVLGALICTLLVISYSVAQQPLAALAASAITVGWIFLVSKYGRVNITAILWGAATSDAETPPEPGIIFAATGVVAVLALIGVIVNAVTGFEFGWYGVALLIAIVVTGAILMRNTDITLNRRTFR